MAFVFGERCEAHVSESRKPIMSKTSRYSENSNSFLANFMKKRQQEKQELIDLFGEDFEQPEVFQGVPMSKAEAGTIKNWLESLKPRILEIQMLSTLPKHMYEDGPYYGAIGGGVTVSVTGTSLGLIITATESITKEMINVSDATNWYFYG